MPTFRYSATFAHDYKKLTREQKKKFQHEVLTKFAPALDAAPPAFPSGLRVKGVQGRSRVFEMTWDGDGRATWQYGPEDPPGTVTILFRRVGTHAIFTDP